MHIITRDAKKTKELGFRTAKSCHRLARQLDRALVLNLEGDLGGGKTTFVQGLAEGLGISRSIPSPTFVLARRYSLEGSCFENFHHFDFYRLEGEIDQASLENLDFQEIVNCPGNIVAIEWSDRLGALKPVGLSFHFLFQDENTRKISIEAQGAEKKLMEFLSDE